MPKKKTKYIRMFIGATLPKTRKERDKLYRLAEGMGIMKQIFANREIIIVQEQ